MTQLTETATQIACPPWCTDHSEFEWPTFGPDVEHRAIVANSPFGPIRIQANVVDEGRPSSDPLPYIYVDAVTSDTQEFTAASARVYAAALVSAADALDRINEAKA